MRHRRRLRRCDLYEVVLVRRLIKEALLVTPADDPSRPTVRAAEAVLSK